MTNLISTDDSRQAPIDRWLALMTSPHGLHGGDLAEIYRLTWPVVGEIIYTGGCEFECVHCIYPPDYSRWNPTLAPADWERIFVSLHADLGIETFVYGGRSVTRAGVEALARLRTMIPQARIGLIDNGISMVPHRASLPALGLQWIDISFDGDERMHDIQRGRPGSFRAALEGARWLKEHRVAPKVNVLTCLTTINAGAIFRMMADLNREGFKNFFITPVSVADGYRPAPSLVVDGMDFVAFVRDLEHRLPELEDAHVEIEIYGANYLQPLLSAGACLGRPRLDRDHLTWQIAEGSVPFAINYYPLSISGTRELCVNSNGDVILPKSMAKGKVTSPDALGSLLEQGAVDIVKSIPEAAGFAFYESQLREERRVLEGILVRSLENDREVM